MTLKQKFLIIWLIAVLAIGFAARHYLGGTAYLFQNMVAFEVVCVHWISKFGALFLGAHVW